MVEAAAAQKRNLSSPTAAEATNNTCGSVFVNPEAKIRRMSFRIGVIDDSLKESVMLTLLTVLIVLARGDDGIFVRQNQLENFIVIEDCELGF
uniref:Uncharacterized protein n=1 Tax=Syphacia muris TaxID=451379 RepID=A0A0N5AP43_9BILA